MREVGTSQLDLAPYGSRNRRPGTLESGPPQVPGPRGALHRDTTRINRTTYLEAAQRLALSR